ncbi:MAG: helix-turn-helix transcriptional regulator [Christensenellaceae bacterium]|nr:helix-turn-helix transcriptional regulator [Christensenellaceae bacterium]
MERDFERELDELKQEIREIKEALSGRAQGSHPPQEGILPTGQVHKMSREETVQKMPGMHQDPNIMAILDRLEDQCNESGSSGRLAYLGVYASGGRQSTWIRADVNADALLGLIEEGTAEKVLACIGSSDRLNLLLTILHKPRTVAQLVGECGFTSTGQVYHHLKPLIAADLIMEDEHIRGTYVIVPHRVQGILMLLAGISDMIDPQFSQGEL